LAFALIVGACKKDKVVSPDSFPLVKTKTDINLGATITYSYDAQGKIDSSRISTASACRYGYLYSDDSITYYFSCYPSSSGINYVYLLNMDKLVARKVEHGTVVEYQYDANGYTAVVNHNPGDEFSSVDSITVVDGNPTEIISISTFDRMPHDGSVTVYREQTINTYNAQINTIGNENFGMAYLGKSSKNLLVSSVTTTLSKTICDGSGCSADPFTNSYSYTYTYEYDDQGRVSKRTELYSLNGSPPSTTTYAYTYY
jgi:YD repeat-containing protein